MKMTNRKDIEQVLWNACDSFRGKIDSSRYKDYILSMLFVKYLSDVSKERREEYIKQYDGDMRRVERAMSRERFAMDEQSTFDYLYANRNDAEIGQKINVALNHIEEHNSGKLRNVFRAIDFNSQVDFGEPKEKNATLRNLLEDFNGLDLRPSQLGSAGEQICAPMPGNILAVNVTAGQTVKKGDVLMVLEAMKMENEIMCPRDGVVASVNISKGASVESGTLLCVLQ